MTRIHAIPAGLLLVSAIAGCGSGADDMSARTTTQIVEREIDQNTADTAVPIEVNDLPISDADTTETGRPKPI